MHINYYIQGAEAVNICRLSQEEKIKLQEVWKAVIDKSNVSSIVVSSLAYIVFDLIGKKVKEKKER